MKSDCLFCSIVTGEIPSDVVLDRGGIFAFRDIAPVAPTHILVVPKEHLRDLSDVGESQAGLLAEMIATANELASSEGIASSGYRVVFNTGSQGGQTVPHLHLHLLGGRQMAWPPG